MRPALLLAFAASAPGLDLSRATIVDPGRGLASTVLSEEVERRTGLRLPVAAAASSGGAAITLRTRAGLPSEGFAIRTSGAGVSVEGADARGLFYGVGYLLRQLHWAPGRLDLPAELEVTSAPRFPIRGHQIGFRATANSWDAWTVAQFDQYFRELALFGVNAIEDIAVGDESKNPLVKAPKREMNRAISQLCQRYGLDYWLWSPVTVDLKDEGKAAQLLDEFTGHFRNAPALTGVFVPGGDPGANAPEVLLPYLSRIAARLRAAHPRAKVWLSLQGFSEAKAEFVYRWLGREVPDWFGGVVAGPSSPPVADTRSRLPAGLKLRLYPDLTHNKISQFEVPEWDQAYALTLGREAINPRPVEYAAIFAREMPLSDGFISYSDGVHDDVNKAIWSALAWDPNRAPRDILIEYCRLYFSPARAAELADAILALERNWRGSLIANGAVEATWRQWRDLEAAHPALAGNWRWQMYLLRANYDAYVRRRLIAAEKSENEANAWLRRAGELGAERAMAGALAALEAPNAAPELRARIEELCARLFQSIGLQTSVAKYQASGAERGAVLDFVDHPLNNRWWLEDEFARVRQLTGEADKVKRLRELADWEHPGEGSFYDDIGNLRKMPHVELGAGEDASPLFWWWDNGRSRARLSWQVTLWPKAVTYEGLDPKGTYVVRTTGYGQALLQMDGRRVRPSIDGQEMHEFKEFPVPESCLTEGRLRLTWERAGDEEHLNWRKHSRLAEVWLLKR